MNSKRIRGKVKDDYNTIAEEFSKTRQSDWKEFDVFVPYLKPGMEVLDLGCGNGRLVDFLKRFQVKSYLGADQSEGLIGLARKAHPELDFQVWDMASPPKLLKKWDAIFMIASFHHLPQKDQKQVLEWALSHLNPGGHLFMTNWNLFQFRFWKAWLKACLWPKWGFKGLEIPWNNGVKRYYYAFSPRELRGLFKRSGFEILEQQNGRNFVTIARV